MEVATARVVNSTQLELVLLSYEIILENLNDNINKIANDEIKNLKISKLFLDDLNRSLNMKYKISYNLKSLYNYSIEKIIECEVSNDKERQIEILKEVKNILEKIYSSYKTVNEKEKVKEKVMDNADEIYAGLTYGVKGLNETIMGNYKRGLKA